MENDTRSPAIRALSLKITSALHQVRDWHSLIKDFSLIPSQRPEELVVALLTFTGGQVVSLDFFLKDNSYKETLGNIKSDTTREVFYVREETSALSIKEMIQQIVTRHTKGWQNEKDFIDYTNQAIKKHKKKTFLLSTVAATRNEDISRGIDCWITANIDNQEIKIPIQIKSSVGHAIQAIDHVKQLQERATTKRSTPLYCVFKNKKPLIPRLHLKTLEGAILEWHTEYENKPVRTNLLGTTKS